MKKIYWFAAVVIAVLFAFFAFHKANTPPKTSNEAAPVVGNQSVVSDSNAQTVDVQIKDFAFNPQTLTIKAGTKVRWTNKDSAAHTVHADQFDSGPIVSGKTFEFTFNTPGSYDYICSIHPMMKGQIVVQ